MMRLNSTCSSMFSSAILLMAGFASHAGGISAIPSHIQVLAASCAACHGPDGNSVGITPVLAGLDRDYFVLQMQAFQSGQRKATVMHQHAKGLTADEIEQLGQYFSQQKRSTPLTPVPQTFEPGLHKEGQDKNG